jgi:hypothetical protein
MLRFARDDDHARFLAGARAAGVLFKRGAYNFAAVAHEPADVALIGAAARAGFDAVARGAQETI